MKVVETFSGIGAQAKALKNANIDFETVATSEWDVHSILSYFLIHNPDFDWDKYDAVSLEEINAYLLSLHLSSDGQKECTPSYLKRLPEKLRRLLYAACKETNNVGSIKNMKGQDIPEDVDLFTYSFPCTDLSNAGSWHGGQKGMAKDSNSRSGMLWEVERVLEEMKETGTRLPHFLLMENVPAILSRKYKKDFLIWQQTLTNLGYVNHYFVLNASNFGIPQTRERCYMVSVLCDFDSKMEAETFDYFFRYNLEQWNSRHPVRRNLKLKDILKIDYSNPKYLEEALDSQANDTASRAKIFEDNEKLLENGRPKDIAVSTLTTRQDRNPNSGVVQFGNREEGKAFWRYLTPRECMLLMGFDEEDYENMVSYDKKFPSKKPFITKEGVYKMTGNSIVTDVLEQVFLQIADLDAVLFKSGSLD